MVLYSTNIKANGKNKYSSDMKKKIETILDEGRYNGLPTHIVVEKLLDLFNVSNRFDPKYTPPFRVGRKQGKAVLDANGREVIFFKDSEEQAKKYCDYLNGC